MRLFASDMVYVLLYKYDLTMLVMLVFKGYVNELIESRMSWCEMLSKAPLKSKLATAQKRVDDVEMVVKIFSRTWIVDLPVLNPNCVLVSR